jgi:hypothetical protein
MVEKNIHFLCLSVVLKRRPIVKDKENNIKQKKETLIKE